MGCRWLLVILIIPFIIYPSGDSDAVFVSVDNTFPEYILDDHINLTGRSTNTSGLFQDDTSDDFDQGTMENITVEAGSVLLQPTLDVTIQNGGKAVLSPGTGTAWDTILHDIYVVSHNGTYYMYYTAMRSSSLSDPRHIGLATSTDGINWTKYAGNPVISSRVESYDHTNVMRPVVMVVNGTFHMFYGGNHGNTGGGTQDVDVCYAYSSDGVNWTKYSGNPVIKNSATATDWNGLSLRPADIMRVDDTYHLYLKGVGTTASGNPKPRLGLYYSSDLTTWTEEDDNPLYAGSATSWEQDRTDYMTVELRNGTYRTWTFSGASRKVGWMSSPDGLNWTDSGSSLIDPTSGTIYSSGLQFPRAIWDGDHYDLWVTCESGGTKVIGLFKVTPEAMEGVFTSRYFTPVPARVYSVTAMDWSSTIPGDCGMDTYFRWTNDSSAWPSWTPITASSKPVGVSALYFQYRADLWTPVDWESPSLDSFCITYNVPIMRTEVQVDGGAWESVDGDINDWYKNVSLPDGDYDITVRATDAKDATYLLVIPVKVDLYPPTGGILIEDGRYAHNSTNVKIDVAANDTHGPIQMQLSRQPDFAGATWMDHIPSATYGLLGDPEGNVTIYLRLRDAAGRISETYNDTIVIDTTPPEGTLLINDGAKYTNSSSVTLRWNATDITGVVAMMVSNDPDFEGALWEDPMHALSWDVGDVDGVHTVYLKIRDMVGWETLLTDDIILDRTPPAASLSIDQDAEYTTSRDVVLNITLYDEHPISYKLANAGDPWPDSWRSTGSPVDVPWSLAAGDDGQRTVRMLVRDAAGNEFVASDDIVLDTTPPEGALEINEGDDFTNAVLVTVGLTASDATSGLDRMRISATDDFGDSPWQSVKDSFTWVLDSGDGQKAVFVQLRDVAGLVTTLDDSIILDTTPPSGTVMIKDVGEIASDPDVELVIDIQDDYGLNQMMVSSDSGFQDAVWIPYSSLHPWDLGDVDGNVNVYVIVSDLGGNTVTASVSTYLDTTPPEFFADIADHTLLRTVDYSRSASDACGLYTLWDKVYDAKGALVGGFSVTLDGVTSFQDRVDTLDITEAMTPGSEELYEFTVEIGVTDLAGWSTSRSFDLTFIPKAPEGALSIEDGAEWTNSTEVDLLVTHTGGLAPSHFRVAISEEGLETAEWLIWDLTGFPPGGGPTGGDYASVTLELPGGGKEVWCQLKGAFDITSGPFSDTIKLDVLAPVIDLVSPTATSTEEASAKLSLTVTDDQDTAPVLEWRINGGEWRTYEGDERVSLKEGDNLIEARSQDAAGNVETSEWTISSDRGLSVGGASWLILVVVLVVVILVGVWYWRNKMVE
jgi:hypothetical protein